MTTLVADLAELSRRVGATSSRTAKIRELAACVRAVDAAEVSIAVQYLAGEIPQGKFGLSYSMLIEASSVAPAPVPSLTIVELDRRLHALAAIRGAGSAAARLNALVDLFRASAAAEREFIFRLLVGELRQGALKGVMIDAIAAASSVPQADLRRAAMYAPDLGALASTAMLEGSGGLRKFDLVLMSPIAPMLAQTAADVGEALEQFESPLAFEWKMDGARIQVHKSRDAVRIYTRSLNDVTAAVPEIAAAVRDIEAAELILDGEAIAFTELGRPHTFQTTMRRFGRKLDVETMQAQLPIRAYFFDCLFAEGRSLVEHPMRERIAALLHNVPDSMQMPRLITAAIGEAQSFYDESIRSGHEGVMAKSLDAPYEAGNRGASWLKIKRAHTLDLVVLAAEWGHGRRSGKLSNLHLGARDASSGEFVMLGKTFKGLTDEMLAWQTRELLAREVRRDRAAVYVRPELVVEIAFSDLQVSSRYPGGLALRLARVKRYRPDKSAEEADTLDAVRRIAGAADF